MSLGGAVKIKGLCLQSFYQSEKIRVSRHHRHENKSSNNNQWGFTSSSLRGKRGRKAT